MWTRPARWRSTWSAARSWALARPRKPRSSWTPMARRYPARRSWSTCGSPARCGGASRETRSSAQDSWRCVTETPAPRRRRHESSEVAPLRREHSQRQPQGRGDRRAQDRESARCDRQDRCGRSVPHRYTRHRRAVAADTGCRSHAASLRARARKLRLGRGGRLGGDQRPGRRHGDLPPAHDLRPVPGLPRRDDMHCENGQFPGLSRDGGFADLLKTNARAVVKLDPILEPKDIAALADAGLTAYHAVRKSVPHLYAGTKAVVIGAGGLGHIGIQCLKALTPTEILVTDPSEEALALAKEWGADQTVQVRDGYVDTVLEMTDGNGAEVVFDYVGERGAQDDAWMMTRPGGSHYVIGYGGMVEVPAIDIISTERNITGNLVGTYNDLVELMVLTAQGKVNLHTSTYPLDAVNDAIQDLNSGNLRGRGILIPEGASAA